VVAQVVVDLLQVINTAARVAARAAIAILYQVKPVVEVLPLKVA
jgi:hypothetical protein